MAVTVVVVRVIAAVGCLLGPLGCKRGRHPIGQIGIGLHLEGIGRGQGSKAQFLEALGCGVGRGLTPGKLHKLVSALNRNLVGHEKANQTHEGGGLGAADDMEFDAVHGFTFKTILPICWEDSMRA